MPRLISRGEGATCARMEPSGCGAAWLARLLGVQEVPGSNPGSPTNTNRCNGLCWMFSCHTSYKYLLS